MEETPLAPPTVVVAVDFDDTLVYTRGDRFINDRYAVTCVAQMASMGIQFVLCTARVGHPYEQAAAWVHTHFPAIKCVGPGVKPKADFYIDNKAVGCPMWIQRGTGERRVDWAQIGQFIIEECVQRTLLPGMLSEMEPDEESGQTDED